MKQYYLSNEERIKTYKKQYRANNKLKLNEWQTNKMKHDINFNLAHALRTRLNTALKRRGISLKSTTCFLGCSISEFKLYIEKQFTPRMNWSNRGITGWHLDHIIPLKSFDLSDETQLAKACHYTNYQPLWYDENIRKGTRIEYSHECPTTLGVENVC